MTQIVYRFTTTASGRKRAEYFDKQTQTWKIVGIKAAEFVIRNGRGTELGK